MIYWQIINQDTSEILQGTKNSKRKSFETPDGAFRSAKAFAAGRIKDQVWSPEDSVTLSVIYGNHIAWGPVTTTAEGVENLTF